MGLPWALDEAFRQDHDLLHEGLPGVSFDSSASSNPIAIGNATVEISPGVRVVAEGRGDEICVQGSDDRGHQTRRRCVTGSGARPVLGGLTIN